MISTVIHPAINLIIIACSTIGFVLLVKYLTNTRKSEDVINDTRMSSIIGELNDNIKGISDIINDMTDAKKYADRLIEENERKYKIILSTIPDYIYIIDEFGNYKEIIPSNDNHVNKVIINSIIGKNICDIFINNEELIDQVKIKIQEAKTKNSTQWLEYCFNGRYFISSITGINHKKERFVWVARDITDLKLKEKKLIILKDYLNIILNSIPDPVAVKSDEFKILFVNDAYCEFTGRTREEILNKKYSEFPIKNSKTEFLINNGDVTALNNGYYVGEEDVDYHNSSKLTKRCIVKKILATGEDGSKYIVVTFHDVQELKNKEKEIEKSKYFLEKILNSISEPIYVKNNNNKYIMVNDIFCEFFNKKREDIIGKTFSDIFDNKEILQEIYDNDKQLINNIFSSDTKNEVEQLITHKIDDKLKIYKIKKNCYIDINRNIFIIGLITEIGTNEHYNKMLTELLLDRNKLLLENSELKEQIEQLKLGTV